MKRSFGIGIVALIFLAIFYPRYLAPFAGVASTGDYPSHVNIEQHLHEALFFPSLTNLRDSPHVVSTSLPVYHGIWGFHLMALLAEAEGIPRPGAYALWMDLSLLILLFFLFRSWKTGTQSLPETAAAFFIGFWLVLPTFFRAVDAAFFPQILATGVLLLAEIYRRRGHSVAATVLALFAAFCYPDFLLWLLPVLILRTGRHFRRLPALAMTGLWLGLVFIYFQRLRLTGAASDNIFAFFFLVLALLLFWKDLRRRDPDAAIAGISFAIIGTALLIGGWRFGGFGYYAQKFIFPSVIFLTYLLVQLPLWTQTKGRIFLLVLVLTVLFFTPLPGKSYRAYLQPPKHINNALALEMKASQEHILRYEEAMQCPRFGSLFFPSPEEVSAEWRELRMSFRASLAPNYEITDYRFIHPALDALYKGPDGKESFVNFLRSFNAGQDSAYQTFFAALATSQGPRFCVVAPLVRAAQFESHPDFQILGRSATEVFALFKK